jgi:fibronectin type 3 domain-containing protein
MKTRYRWCVAVCLLALAAASACGRKTSPLVPDSPRPEAIKAIKAVSRGGVVYLTWQMPTRNIEGKSYDPSSIRKILIDRAEPVQDHKKARYRRSAEIDVADMPPSLLRNNVATWADGQVRYGQTYAYRLRAVSAHGISPWSEPVLIVPQSSLAAPKGVAAARGDSSVRLTWEPVRTLSDGGPAEGFIGYNVYRGTEKGIHDEAPLNREPITATSYKDATAVNEHTYYYIVRAVNGPAPDGRESPDSVEVSATPRDLTPPAKPKGLTVVGGVDRAFLTWNENHEADLAGYHVYRSKRSGRGYVRLTEKPVNRTTFSDEGAKGGAVYYYVVTAVDRSGNESARSVEKKTSVEKLR